MKVTAFGSPKLASTRYHTVYEGPGKQMFTDCGRAVKADAKIVNYEDVTQHQLCHACLKARNLQ